MQNQIIILKKVGAIAGALSLSMLGLILAGKAGKEDGRTDECSTIANQKEFTLINSRTGERRTYKRTED